jgi:prepilin-type N-terminal cleavage/methylation domain-containing protein
MTATTERGMTLMECAAALALIGIAILAAGAFLSVQPQVTDRLQAQREAVRALEYTLESVRAGALPLVSGAQAVSLPASPDAVRNLTVTLRVSPGERPGLFVVAAEAIYSAGGKRYRRQLATMVWRPS